MFETVRIVLLLILLGIVSYFDIKQREVSDYWWLVFGIAGIGIYFFDWKEHFSYDILTIIITLVVASLMWKFFPIGKADILAFVCIGVLLPTLGGFIMVPIVLLAGSAVIAGISTVSYNVVLNTKDGIAMRRSPFFAFDESIIRKLLAFLMIHKKRDREKFSICAEQFIDGKKKFCLGIKNPKSEFTKDGVFVECGVPLLPYMLAVCVLLVLAIL
ncbi:prepilin peptidase [Nitrosopumilus ureiphilus]|uniref:Prepilin type IV endopeptidase peptidase domain-containing protein n=1 Tax=Nitrosopumilus ureiphilus TaxID=1470067 RepID=A0A7D5M8K5_9ARCH|nr:hypothetical protein [Nitrosopumilus ureiphilus]QLH07108.1 hypothetical protein C5F50_08510 [Nitrosopumilus ureiphilus]